MKVELLQPVKHDNVLRKVGEVIDMAEDQAEALVKVGAARVTKAAQSSTVDGVKAQAETLLQDAKAKADQLVADAKEEVAKMKADAKEEVAALKAQAEADAKAAAEELAKGDANKTPAAEGDAKTGDTEGDKKPEGQANLKAVPNKQGSK